MQLSLLLLGAAMASSAAAQKVFAVLVGSNGTLTFSPNNIKANVGDMVQFQFQGGNHTVTQSNFDNPCQPINNFSPNVTGFHSGFVPAAASAAMGKIASYTIMINSTNPIWAYCAQAKHCEAGMSMVINENTAANSTRSLANYKSMASQATTVIPGSAGTNNNGGASGTPGGSAAGNLAIPSTLSLLVFGVAVLLL